MKAVLITALLLLGITGTGLAAAPSMDQAIAALQHGWAQASYRTPDNAKEAAFSDLATRARKVTVEYAGHPEPMIWEAIILASYAKAEGGLGALSKAKEARDMLLAAAKINPTALDGSIYNSLGSLYAKVPGWPIGFGDKKKAKHYFKKALALNPNGIEPNYFYADLLADQGEYAKAADHLKRALAAPARPGREDADAGRRQEVIRLLDTLKKNHGDELVSK